MAEEEKGSNGIVEAEDVVAKHSDGFDAALDAALRKLTRGGNYNLQPWVTVTDNPGGVSHYGVDLTPRG